MTPVEQLAQQALALEPGDRAYLADVLEQSLASGGFATTELAEAWAAEIDRRLNAYKRGEAQPSDADVVLERIRQRVVDHRRERPRREGQGSPRSRTRGQRGGHSV